MSLSSQDIYHTDPAGGLALAWVNSYSATVVKTPGATLLFDPVSLKVPDDVCLDLIAISHGHSDHWDPKLVAGLRQRTRAVVATSPFLASRLRALARRSEETPSTSEGTEEARGRTPPTPPCEGGARCVQGSSFGGTGHGGEERPLPGSVVALQPGEWLRIGDVTVAALRCDHAAEEPVSFLVRTADGFTVYLPGDSTPFPAMDRLPVPHPESLSQGERDSRRAGMPVDVLLWMGTALGDGARIARLVRPKVLVTYAIAPPAAGARARDMLARLTPDLPLHALERHQVFVYPPQSHVAR